MDLEFRKRLRIYTVPVRQYAESGAFGLDNYVRQLASQGKVPSDAELVEWQREGATLFLKVCSRLFARVPEGEVIPTCPLEIER